METPMRPSGRAPDEMRAITIETGYTKHAEGSCLISFGETRVLCTARGFNYPHQIAVWYAMYRTARNHPRLYVRRRWEWYLARAANTTLRRGLDDANRT